MSLKNIRGLIEAAQNKLSLAEMFVQDLERAVRLIEIDNRKKPSQSYKPSSLNCIRQMYFQMVGVEPEYEEPSTNLIGICESGSDRHERIQRVVSKMKELGLDCEYLDVAQYVQDNNLTDIEIIKKKGFETKLYHKVLKLSFLCDGLIRYQGRLFVLEIKTESSFKFAGRNAIAEEHKSQGTAYSTVFAIDDVIFVYENRDNCGKKGFILNVTPAMKIDLFLSKLETCEEYLKNNTVPPRPEKMFKKTCEYCSYRQLCKESN